MRSLPDRHFVTNPRLCPRKKHALLAAILASGKYGHVYLSYRSRLFRVHWAKLIHMYSTYIHHVVDFRGVPLIFHGDTFPKFFPSPPPFPPKFGLDILSYFAGIFVLYARITQFWIPCRCYQYIDREENI